MSRYNPKVFTDVDSLGKLDGNLLAQFLKRFPKFLNAHDIHLDNGGLDYEKIRTTLMNPKEEVLNDTETHDLMEALHLVTEMSDHGSMDAFLTAARQQGMSLDSWPKTSSEDVSLYCWLNHSSLFHTLYAKTLVQNFKSFSYFLGGTGEKRKFPTYTEETVTALQNELDDWFAENNRLRNCRVYFFPQGHRVSIVIKYGMPLKREMKMENGDSESIFYNPQRHDLLIYNCDYDEISVKTDNKKGQESTYLNCIGKHIFGNEAYFREKKCFSLEKLGTIDSATYDFATVSGIEDVKLVELQYEWGGEIEIRKSPNLLGRLIGNNAREVTKKAKISSAKFRVRFEGNDSPRVVRIQSGNQATFGRDDDSLVIEDWINDQGLIDRSKQKSGKVQHVEEAREPAEA
jgi:hypothetical protein